ncbi:hypothetical protein GCM10008088_24490 [Mesonia mobilis]|uniref:Uncharacterized protein n=1 Tax=Mesonia mobilis TaxID=369791 RepID=A0ABQ3BZN1_9FLAO|nr:hypothetical protein GCM10008088_24490 [Mesonia mobilis]
MFYRVEYFYHLDLRHSELELESHKNFKIQTFEDKNLNQVQVDDTFNDRLQEIVQRNFYRKTNFFTRSFPNSSFIILMIFSLP